MRYSTPIHVLVTALGIAAILALNVTSARAQLRDRLQFDSRIEAGSYGADPSAPVKGARTSKRQAMLIGGMAVSMAAYGYFTLEFNNSRGDAGDAERAYEEDVRQNAQSYVDQGIELDEIPTFRDWQTAYDDAKNSREWAARAGFFAIVIGLFAVLDAATSYDGPTPRASGIAVHPTLAYVPLKNDLVIGARVKF